MATLALWPSWNVTAVTVANLLVFAQLVVAIATLGGAMRRATGTRRLLFGTLAAACACALLFHAEWGVIAPLVRGAPSPAFDAAIGIAMQSVLMLGFATALGRFRHRNWMRFEALVDAALLVVAVMIVVVQLDTAPAGELAATPAALTMVLLWNGLAAGNLVLVALLLVWRGEMLGTRLATGLALGAVAMALGTFLYGRVTVLDAEPVSRIVLGLWTTFVFCIVTGTDPARAIATGDSAESPTFRSDASRVRSSSIVAAILVASVSTATLAMRGEPRPRLGMALALFGVLLALRTGHALLTQHRTTVVLEHENLAERELSQTLEQRVAARTGELAEAHRVLQRMWTLGQQIALELQADRVLQRFLEAAMDVLRVDGGAVGFASDERVRVMVATGLAQPLAGAEFPVSTSALGRVTRGEPWWTAEPAATRDEDLAALGTDTGAVALVPLQRRGERIGAVLLTARGARRFTDVELAHVEAMADLLSVALANADLVETLRQTEWRFRTLFRAAPDLVLTMFASGRVREANDAARDVFGLFAMQMAGRTLEEFVLPDDHAVLRERVALALRGVPARFEVRVRCGEEVKVLSIAARSLPETEPPMVLLVGRDITAERDMRARLAEAERLAAVGAVVAGVAHEVNNPLGTISAFAQLLERDHLTPEQRESVEAIRAECRRASEVVRDLLTFARRRDGERVPVQLNELVERTMRLRGFELSTAGIRSELSLDPMLPLVQGDPHHLQQVLANLITNAVQVMAGRSDGVLRIATTSARDAVHLDVSDTGGGIPVSVRDHIFEPFFTTKPEGQGTGLGLSVSYGIVSAHGGTIEVLRTSSAGTTLRVTLPAFLDATIGAPEPAGEAPDGAPPALGSVRR